MTPATGRSAATCVAQRRPEAAPEYDDALAVDPVPRRDGVVDRQRIGGKLALARLALAGAVTAIVDRNDRPLAWPARVGERMRNLFGVAAEVDDRGRRRGAALDDPAVKAGTVRGRDGERRSVRGQMRRRPYGLREEDQAVLREPCGCGDADDDCNDGDQPFHRSVPLARSVCLRRIIGVAAMAQMRSGRACIDSTCGDGNGAEILTARFDTSMRRRSIIRSSPGSACRAPPGTPPSGLRSRIPLRSHQQRCV